MQDLVTRSFRRGQTAERRIACTWPARRKREPVSVQLGDKSSPSLGAPSGSERCSELRSAGARRSAWAAADGQNLISFVAIFQLPAARDSTRSQAGDELCESADNWHHSAELNSANFARPSVRLSAFWLANDWRAHKLSASK